MKSFVRPLLFTAFVIWFSATFVFLLLRFLPGDAVETQLRQSGAPLAVIDERRTLLGLTKPITIQYIDYMANLFKGDLGYSLVDGLPVTELIGQQLWPTMTLAGGALTIAVVLGLILGTAATIQTPWRLAIIARIIVNLSLAVPIYWTGTIAIFLVTLLPVRFSYAGAGRPIQLLLPVLVLGFHTSGVIARLTQARITETLNSDFIRTARGKGLSEQYILFHHTLRAGLPPIMSVIALQAGFLFGGTVITETLFVRPGIGQLLLSRTIQQDYPVVQGIVILASIGYAVFNGLADILYRILDPRVAT